MNARSKMKESIYANLRRRNLLDRVIGSETGRQLGYADRLILDSDRLLHEPPGADEMVSLKAMAERAFSSATGWVFALKDDTSGWVRERAEELGRCFAGLFGEIKEELPLYVRDGAGYRVAGVGDESYTSVMTLMKQAGWVSFTVDHDPPPWSEALFIKRSDLELHRNFFGAYWDWDDQERAEEARALRVAAYKQALATRSQQQKFLRTKLRAVVELWPEVQNLLGLSGMYTTMFIERTFDRLGLTLYLDEEETGLWSPVERDKQHDLLAELGCSSYADSFFGGREVASEDLGWEHWRMTPRDFEIAIREAHELARVNSEPESSPSVSAPVDVTALKARIAELESALAIERQRKNTEPRVTELTKKLKTSHRMILGMARATYGWDPDSEKPQPATGSNNKSIHADMIKYLGSAPDADTIRKTLREAAETFKND
jgi:hypothetical protein